jgi:hypothetical protein
MSVQSMVKKKNSALRASFTRLRFKGKAGKKNTAQSMVAGTVKIKKITTSAFCLCATRQECALSFSFTFSFLAFICVLRLCAFPFHRLEYSLFLICATRFLLILFSSLTRIHVHIHLHIYIYIYIYVQPPGLSYRVFSLRALWRYPLW